MVRSLSTISKNVYNLEAEFLALGVQLMHAVGARTLMRLKRYA